MKQLLILSLLLSITLEIKAQFIEEGYYDMNSMAVQTSNLPTVFCGAVTYNINDPQLIVDMDIDLAPYEQIDINMGILSSCEINGSHIHFTISQDTFMDHIYPIYKDKGFWDMQISIITKATSPSSGQIPVIVKYGIIRIIF